MRREIKTIILLSGIFFVCFFVYFNTKCSFCFSRIDELPSTFESIPNGDELKDLTHELELCEYYNWCERNLAEIKTKIMSSEGRILKIKRKNNYYYIATPLKFLIISLPSYKKVAEIELDPDHFIRSINFALQKDLVYITMTIPDSKTVLKVFKLSNSSLKEISSLDLPGTSIVGEVKIHQNKLFVANGWSGIRIIDISNPYKIKEIGHASSGLINSRLMIIGAGCYAETFDYGRGNDGYYIIVNGSSGEKCPEVYYRPF